MMMHFDIGPRRLFGRPAGSSMNAGMPRLDRPSVLDAARMGLRLGIVNKAVQLGGRAAMSNPRLSMGLMRRALPDMPWQARRSTWWQQGWGMMPWQSRSAMPWPSWQRMPWQQSQSWMPWQR